MSVEPECWSDVFDTVRGALSGLLFASGILAVLLLLGIAGMLLFGMAPRWTVRSLMVVVVLCALACWSVSLILWGHPLAGAVASD